MYIYNGYSVVNEIQNRISKDIGNCICAVDIVDGGWPAIAALEKLCLDEFHFGTLPTFCDLFNICVRRSPTVEDVHSPHPIPPACQRLCVRSLPSGDEKHPLCHHGRDFLAASESLQQIANTAPVTRRKEKSYDLHPKNNPGHLIVNSNLATPIEKSQCLFCFHQKSETSCKHQRFSFFLFF